MYYFVLVLQKYYTLKFLVMWQIVEDIKVW